jgi:hypothetical protein
MLVKYVLSDIGLVLREKCKSKQMSDFIAWQSRCHDTICDDKKVFKGVHMQVF